MTETIESRISQIIAERKKNLPQVQSQYATVNGQISKVKAVISSIDRLLEFEKKIDEEQLESLREIRAQLVCAAEDYGSVFERLGNLEARFSRETINIGVSGEARVGKSSTLQSFSGLSDTQIPTGSGLPVTAVRSEIFNSPDSYASIEFRDAQTFIDDYIQPHLDNINETGACSLSIKSLAELRSAKIPESLGENVNSRASMSLRSLKDAQESIDSYAALLTGSTVREPIDSIRKYVAYPTNDEINSGKPVNRAYLAVKSVKVFSNFPSLDGERIGLIDLPGLGEIGKSVAAIHTSGLENGVDQILLIMRPTQAEGFVKAGIAQNVDQLRSIQAGISRRSDLIVAAINNDETNSQSAKTLRDNFESVINASQTSDKIEIRDFCAVDEESVRNLFDYLLNKLVDALPAMDADVFSYVLNDGVGEIDKRCEKLLGELVVLANRIMKTIPLEDSYLDALADNLSRSLIFEYDGLEESRYADANSNNPLRAALEKQVSAICSDNERRIDSGLFLASESAWTIHARGRADYVNFLRSEAKRIKAEIIDSYRRVDLFYDGAIHDLKKEVLKVFFDNTGYFYEYAGIDISEDYASDENIQKLVDSLDSVTRDEGFAQCFRFISEVSFKFSQNVFYNIYSSLEELHNPDADQRLGERGLSGADRIEIARVSLKDMARTGNSEIKEQILAYNDRFNRFLFTCMTFFNDFLYRKDDRRFERNTRILIKECRDYVIPDEQVDIDRDMLRAIKRLKDSIAGNGTEAYEEPAKQERPVVAARQANPKPAHNPLSENAERATLSSISEKKAEEKSSASKESTQKKNASAAPSKKGGSSSQPVKKSGYVGNYNQEW